MATTTTRKKKTTDKPVRMTAAMWQEKYNDLQTQFNEVTEGSYCYMCDKHRGKDRFYMSTDPMIKSGVCPICKDCARKIALRVDKNGEPHEPTMESVKKALYYLNKPFLQVLWDGSISESSSDTKQAKANVWTAYIKNVQMPQYNGLTYLDSDMYKEKIIYEDEQTPETLLIGHEDQDTYTDYMKNKNDVIRLLSYDPFEKESILDQPFLYSQLLGLIDANPENNDDMMRTASCISIVRNFLQSQKIDDTLAKLMSDVQHLEQNSAVIKSLQDSKSKITSVIKDLAAESCISLKNNRNTKKGENTWTGKIKKIKDMNLREGEINGFDIDTSRGMRQVMDASNESILKALRLDESEYSDMLAEMRKQITSLRDEAGKYKEISRILLRENIDLKDYMEAKDILPKDNLIDLNQLFSTYSGEEVVVDVDTTDISHTRLE